MTEAPAALHSAAVRHLTSMLATRRFWASVEGGPSEDELDDPSATVETLVAIGALSADEGRAWRARLERALAKPAADPALRARAGERLEALAAGGGSEAALEGAIAAYAGSGLISRDEEREWLDRLGEDEPPVRTGAMWMSIGPTEPGFDDSVLVRALLGPAERVAGLRVTVVELYGSGVGVHWHFADDGTPEARAFARRIAHDVDFEDDDPFGEDVDDDEWLGRHDMFQLRDDRGTRYRSASASWGSREEATAASGFDGFGPAVPSEAAFLELVVEGLPLRIVLAGGG